jgi:hypothetical protein
MSVGKPSVFLIAHYLRVPKVKGWSSQKDFGKNEEAWQWNETVDFAKKLSNKEFKTAAVVLDLVSNKIIRNSMRPNATYDELYAYYYSNGFSKQMDQIREAKEEVENAVKETLEKFKSEQTGQTTSDKWEWPTSESMSNTSTNDNPVELL